MWTKSQYPRLMYRGARTLVLGNWQAKLLEMIRRDWRISDADAAVPASNSKVIANKEYALNPSLLRGDFFLTLFFLYLGVWFSRRGLSPPAYIGFLIRARRRFSHNVSIGVVGFDCCALRRNRAWSLRLPQLWMKMVRATSPDLLLFVVMEVVRVCTIKRSKLIANS